MLRAGVLVSASGAMGSANTTLVSAFETEVVIPNRTKYRTYRRLFTATRRAHDLEIHCFRLVAGFERQTNAIPVVRAARRHLRSPQRRAGSRVHNLNEWRTAGFELVSAHIIFEIVLAVRRDRNELSGTDTFNVAPHLKHET